MDQRAERRPREKTCTAPGRYCHSVLQLCTAALIMRASFETDNLVPPVQHAKQIPSPPSFPSSSASSSSSASPMRRTSPLPGASHNSRLMGEPNDCRGARTEIRACRCGELHKECKKNKKTGKKEERTRMQLQLGK